MKLKIVLQLFPRATYHTEPYHYQTLMANFSKTTRQKLIVKLYSDKERLTLKEYIVIFNFCRTVFEKLAIKV